MEESKRYKLKTLAKLTGLLAIVVLMLLVWRTAHPIHSSAVQPKTELAKTADSNAKDASLDWRTYKNDQYGVSWQHPSSWQVDEVVFDQPTGSDNTIFVASLKPIHGEKYGETAQFAIHTHDLDSLTHYYDHYFGQSSDNHIKKHASSEANDRQTATYLVTNGGINSKLHLYAAHRHSYSFTSINEEINQHKHQDYWQIFDRIVNSLQFN